MSKTVTSGGAFPTTTKVIDVYQAGRIAYETDGANTTLATFTYAPNGTSTSVTVGSHPSTDPRYYYVYNPHGDVVALVDGGGTTVATYSYDAYGTPTIWESLSNGWHNPYLYDGQELVRYDAETSLYWMSVRAYDPTLGRFISHDPLGRAPLFFDASQPYAYGANNPLRNTDPSGQMPGGAFVEGDAFWYPSTAPSRVQTLLISCDNPTPAIYSNCYASWQAEMGHKRWDHLTPMRIFVGVTVGVGAILIAVVLGALLAVTKDTLGQVLILADMFGNLFFGLSSAFALLTASEGQGSSTDIENVTAGATHGFLGLLLILLGGFGGMLYSIYNNLRSAANFIRSWGTWARRIADLAVTAAKGAFGGPVGALLSALLEIGKSAGQAIAAGAVHLILAAVAAIKGGYDHEINMGIEDWCAQYGSGVCTAPPPHP